MAVPALPDPRDTRGVDGVDALSSAPDDVPPWRLPPRWYAPLAILAVAAIAALAYDGTHHDRAKTAFAADAYAGRYLQCQAQVNHAVLAAPFWLDSDHFNRPTSHPVHTADQVLRRYRTDQIMEGLRTRRAQVAFASYSNADSIRQPLSVWIVVSYGVSTMPTTSSTSPLPPDQIVIYDDRDLASRGILASMPTRCR